MRSSQKLAEGVHSMAMSESERMGWAAEHEAGGPALFLTTMPAALGLVILGIIALARIDPLLLVSIGVIVAGVLLVSDSAVLAQQDCDRSCGESQLSYRRIATSPRFECRSAGRDQRSRTGPVGYSISCAAHADCRGGDCVRSRGIVRLCRTIAVARSPDDDGGEPEQSAKLALLAASSTSTAAIFTGVGLITLGVLALAGIAVDVLMAIALLGLGAYILLEDADMAEYFMSLFGRQ
jgi:hypothetical protein